MSSSNLPPWDLLSFVFGLYAGDKQLPGPEMARCSNFNVRYWASINGRTANPQPTPPYNLVLYSGGYEPWTVSMNNSAITGSTPWLANLPVGSAFAIAMKDSRGYSGGILEYMVHMTPGLGCDSTSTLKRSSLSIDVDSNSTRQCGEALVTVNNGAPPFTLEIIRINIFKVDLSADTKYLLAVSDSQGSSGVKGPYVVKASPDNSCLGEATTVVAGKFSTLYSGGTALPTEVSGAPDPSIGHRLPTNVAIVMALSIPLSAIAFAVLLLWLCFRRSTRYYSSDSHERVGYPTSYVSEYTPVPTEYIGPATSSTSDGSFCTSNSLLKLSSSVPPEVPASPNSHYIAPLEAEAFDPGTLHPPKAIENCS
ncbi:unnamed protein product [Rhizoctonia solani]|uniref:Uncharacterized protein n=1 Tax=Rhizoctonia solani TaxID=456999 RepID=A0A8H3AIC7_9AGAM|nr:unnamed protein product [Rhizoctonia solani]